MVVIITYIPSNSSERNEQLLRRVKQYNTWAILNATNYIVKVKGKTVTDIRDELAEFLQPKDKLMVSELSGNAAWRGFGMDISDWLKKHL